MKKLIMALALLFVSLIIRAQLPGGPNSKLIARGTLGADSSLIPPFYPQFDRTNVGDMYLDTVTLQWKVRLADGVYHNLSTGSGSLTFDANFFITAGSTIKIDTGKIATFFRLYKVSDSLGARIDALVLAAGSGDSSFIRTTYAALDAAGQLDSTKLVYLKDSTRQGIFYHSGHAANQSGDDGGVNIITTTGQIWSRLFVGPVDAKWFDIRQNSLYASSNIINLRKARDYTGKAGRQLVVDGNYTFADSIWFASSSTVRPDVVMRGVTKFTSPSKDGFVLTGYLPLRFVHTGIIDGNNSGGTDSSSFATYTGAGIRMKNLYNSYVDVNEMTDFRDGLLMTGEQSGGAGTGSQFNELHYGYLHHNYANLHLTIIGSATGGNFVNESFWYGRQLGQGVPGSTYGARGTFGLLIDRDPSSNAPQNAIGGHAFYNLDVEASHIAIKATMVKDITFFGAQFEPRGSDIHIMLDTAAATGAEATTFIASNTFNENFFAPGWNGHNTKFTQTRINSLRIDGTGCCVIAGTDMYRLNTTKKFLIFNYQPTGFTDETLNLLNDRLFFTSDSVTTENGKTRFNGEWRYGAYKKQFLNINAGNTSTTGDDTLTAPPNLGFVRVNTNENKVVRINSGDRSTRFFEDFDVELQTAFTLSFISSTGSVLIAASNFPATGKYKCVYRSGAYAVWPYGGTGTSTGSWTISGNNQYSGVPGNVGIGVSNPGALLELGASNTTRAQLLLNPGQGPPTYKEGQVFLYGGYAYLDAGGIRQKLATESNTMTFTGKTTFTPYEMPYSQQADLTANNVSGITSVILDGVQTLSGENLSSGDVIEMFGSGTLSSGIGANSVRFSVTAGGNPLTPVIGLTAGTSGQPFFYQVKVFPRGNSTSSAVKIYIKVTLNGAVVYEQSTAYASGFNSVDPTVNVGVLFSGSVSNGLTSDMNTIEVKKTTHFE